MNCRAELPVVLERRRADSSIVIVVAPAMDDALRQVSAAADGERGGPGESPTHPDGGLTGRDSRDRG
ncbi:MAG TPA: hypothetical protein HA263_05915 [Methanoregulaceae archaeon]|nr:hypothetical protein [Methanoregulaceae archaeon]